MKFIAWTLAVWGPVALFASVASGNDVLTGFAVVFAFPIYTVGVLAMFRRSGRGG